MDINLPYKFTTHRCEPCNIGLQEEQEYKNHLLTPYHKNVINGYKKNIEDIKNNKKLPYYCNICNIDCHKKNTYDAHIATKKHKNNENGVSIIKTNGVFQCEDCNLTFTTKQSLQIHNESLKHLRNTKQILEETKEQEQDYQCLYCEKKYNWYSGLWRHIQKNHKEHKDNYEYQHGYESETEPEQKKENITIDIENNEILKNHKNHTNEEIQQNLTMLMTPEIIAFLIQQNKSVQEMILEQNKTMIEIVKNMGNITNNNNSHSHNTTNNIQNNKFNLNVFLNETCKDAMNMSDFLERLDVTTYDFEETGKNGYVQGMCRILENGLNQLEVHERPIHCTDAKRETIYIKENDKWEKDDDKKTKLTSVIKQVGAKNIKMIPQWCKEHPGWNDGDSKENDRYLKYVFNSMCGGTDEEIHKNYGDIARYISKITVVDKKEAIMQTHL